MKDMAGMVVPLPPTDLCFEHLGALKDLLHGQGGGEHSRLPLDDALDDRVHVLGGGRGENNISSCRAVQGSLQCASIIEAVPWASNTP